MSKVEEMDPAFSGSPDVQFSASIPGIYALKYAQKNMSWNLAVAQIR